jgi:multicomponent Na+:H+ antiporter subunit D
MVFIALTVGILTIYSMTKIWTEAFWRPADDVQSSSNKIPIAQMTPVILMAVTTVFIGIFAEVLIKVSIFAAQQLIHPELYINAVLESMK